jgi:hypothetical protein
MRILAWAILAMVLTATPTLAQTYDPAYPVCLHVYKFGGYYDCSYTSLPQCNMSASGRGALCVVNPYYARPAPRLPEGFRTEFDKKGWRH